VLAQNFNNVALINLIRWVNPIEWYHWFNQLKQNANNTVQTSERQIDVHYNIGNDWYSAFLDESMTYTCGRFDDFNNFAQSLEDAQRLKRAMIMKKSLLYEGENKRVLDIGCGWGTLCHEMSQMGSIEQVTGICNSEAMIDFCNKNYQNKNCNYLFSDYRNYQDTALYDVITNVEMLEAIGVENFEEFAQICDRLLKPRGRVVIQVITAPRFLNSVVKKKRKTVNECFVTTYIFPGGQVPHIEWVHEAFNNNKNFKKVHLESFGRDYVKTLQCWRKNLVKSKKDGVVNNYSDSTFRAFEYYLAWCEGGFATECLDVHQIVFEKNDI